MKYTRRLIVVGAMALLCAGLSSAAPLTYTAAASFGPNTTDFSWTLNLPSFTLPAGDVLTGVTLDVTGSSSSVPFALTNTAATEELFGLNFFENLNITGNTGSSAAVGDAVSMELFTSGGHNLLTPNQTIDLGPLGSGSCPDNSPSSACNSVSYTGVSATGDDGVYNISSAFWNNYAAGITLTGNTNSSTVFNGGGGNIGLNQSTVATVNAAVVFTYGPAGAPEPATLFLMGSALVGVGLLRKRIKF